jgi:hypothetical protein
MNGDLQRIREALRFIPVGGHDERVRVAFMLKSEFGDVASSLWDEWRDGRGDDEAASVWKSSGEGGGLTIGTLFFEAKRNGWQDDGTRTQPTQEELAERRRESQERESQAQAQTERKRAIAADKAAAIWTAASPADGNPYLTRKGVAPVETLREIDAGAAAKILGYVPQSGGEPLTGRLLVVPVEVGERLSTSEPIGGDGRKTALARGAKKAGYWASEALPEGNGAGGNPANRRGPGDLSERERSIRAPGGCGPVQWQPGDRCPSDARALRRSPAVDPCRPGEGDRRARPPCSRGGGRRRAGSCSRLRTGPCGRGNRLQRRVVPIAPGGTLSDYVPFYFTPYTPMMYNIKTGMGVTKVPNDEIVIFVSRLPWLRELGIRFVFSDRHAYLQAANFYSTPEDLDKIPWKLLQEAISNAIQITRRRLNGTKPRLWSTSMCRWRLFWQQFVILRQ